MHSAIRHCSVPQCEELERPYSPRTCFWDGSVLCMCHPTIIKTIVKASCQFYCIVLSFTSILRTSWQDIFSNHCFALLFASLLIEIYRNIWPLATYTEVPADAHDGPFLWARLALLFVIGVAIPLFSPRKYVPVNPTVGFCLIMQHDAEPCWLGG